MENLTFERLRVANIDRDKEVYHDLDKWQPTDWACALAGEIGEACNLIKKLKKTRDAIAHIKSQNDMYMTSALKALIEKEKSILEDIGKELADSMIYLDLLATACNLNLAEELVKKFDLKSDETKSTIFLN